MEAYNLKDGEELVTCPFDESHQIRMKRYQYHFHKCQKNHPNIKVLSCSFNARHKVIASKLADHHANCPDRIVMSSHIVRDKYVKENMETPDPVLNIRSSTEDWDAELSDHKFFLNSGGINIPKNHIKHKLYDQDVNMQHITSREHCEKIDTVHKNELTDNNELKLTRLAKAAGMTCHGMIRFVTRTAAFRLDKNINHVM